MIAYIITGEDEEIIPQNATHVSVHPSVAAIPARLFWNHQNIVELICHDGVIKIEERAFWKCPRLKRVIILGVKVVKYGAFYKCEALKDLDCPKLEMIGQSAFNSCESLSSINLTSVKVVEGLAFGHCEVLTDVKFGTNLGSIEELAFWRCCALERVTIPLKNGLITQDDIYKGCANLKRIDFVDATALDETIAALLLDGWRNDINAEIDAINQILRNVYAGSGDFPAEDLLLGDDVDDDGEMAIAIRGWISRVLDKIISCKAKHRDVLNEVSSTLQRILPDDIVANNVIPFLELPSHTFDGEGEEDDDEEESVLNSDDSSEYTSENDEDDNEEDEGEDESVDGGDDEEQAT